MPEETPEVVDVADEIEALGNLGGPEAAEEESEEVSETPAEEEVTEEPGPEAEEEPSGEQEEPGAKDDPEAASEDETGEPEVGEGTPEEKPTVEEGETPEGGVAPEAAPEVEDEVAPELAGPDVDALLAELARVSAEAAQVPAIPEPEAQAPAPVEAPVEQPAAQPPVQDAGQGSIANLVPRYRFVDETTHEQVMQSPEALNQVLNSTMVQAVEIGLRAVSGMVSESVANQISMQRAADDFYDLNPDFGVIKPYVQKVGNAIHAAHPDWDVAKLFNETEVQVRKALQMKKASGPAARTPAQARPAPGVARRGGRRAPAVKDTASALTQEIEDLLEM